MNYSMANNKKNDEKKITEFRFNFNIKTVFIIAFVGLFLFYLYSTVSKEVQKVIPERPLTSIIQDIRQNRVDKVDIIDNKVLVYTKTSRLP